MRVGKDLSLLFVNQDVDLLRKKKTEKKWILLRVIGVPQLEKVVQELWGS